MLESSSVLSRLHTTRGRSADASVNWLNFSAGLRIVYHFSPDLTLASGATALGSVRAQASLNQTDDPLPVLSRFCVLPRLRCNLRLMPNIEPDRLAFRALFNNL